MCGATFFLRGGARVKIHGAGWGGAKGKIPWCGAGLGKKVSHFKCVNRIIPKILQKCVNEKYNMTYYKINYKINHNIIILAEIFNMQVME